MIEVYPAATLKVHGLPHQGYKKNTPEHAAVREELVERISEMISLPDDPLLTSNADALDAMVCVSAGLDFLDGACIEAGVEAEIRESEGWIWVR